MVRIHTVTAYRRIPVAEGWTLCSTAPDTHLEPTQLLVSADQNWLPAPVPGTVIGALLHNQGKKSGDDQDFSLLEAQDWWYQTTFDLPPAEPDRRFVLCFAGLATAADAWLNGEHILRAENMFRSYEVDVTALLAPTNTLVVRFASLAKLLARKRPRPRWRPQLIDQQQLRWWRTTLLGHMPGWSPPQPVIGPWRSIFLEERSLFTLDQVDLRASVQDDLTTGSLSFSLQASAFSGSVPAAASLVIAERTFPLALQVRTGSAFEVSGTVQIPDVQLWWPHTHGAQPLYTVQIQLQYGGTRVLVDCGRVAFRRVELLQGDGDDFCLQINKVPVFCRGACWTPLSMTSLSGSQQEYFSALSLAQQAGMNMLRLSGTMVYETDLFYDLCDELGLLVWQDFMFANMDYPFQDATFLANVRAECEQLLKRLQTHPCLALLCGNTEIQQQVAMLGLPPDMARNEYFDSLLPALCRAFVDVPYWTSTPGGGAVPFQMNAGTAHYQGVGAYLRPMEDVRRSEVRFAPECLSFANIPEDETLDLVLRPGEAIYHHAKWKARVPRDHGAGWDFDDIRDYYLELLFSVDPMKLRYADRERYIALSRVVPGEVMAAVYADWRRVRSTCHGGLIWLYRDLWPGAGWGVLDATGYPKASYFYLKRILARRACFFSDEGLSGLYLHTSNDTAEVLDAAVRLSVYRNATDLVESITHELLLDPHQGKEIHVDPLFSHFMDLTYAYRFGPPGHDVVVATLVTRHDQRQLSEAFYFPHGLALPMTVDCGLQAQAERSSDASGSYVLTLQTQRLAQSVAIHAEKFVPEENYFHLAPGSTKTVVLHPCAPVRSFQCTVSVLNAQNEIHIYD